jgi:hypothetical protein
MWWLTSVILATWEILIGRSRFEVSLDKKLVISSILTNKPGVVGA